MNAKSRIRAIIFFQLLGISLLNTYHVLAQPGIKVVALQAGELHSAKGNPGFEANFNTFYKLAREAAKAKPDLIVFPEYAISGWPYPAENEFNKLAEAVPGTGYWYKKYTALAKEIKTPLLAWLLEQEDGKIFNCAALIDENGIFVSKYRKVHANLGEQTWFGWSQGEDLTPITFKGIKYGISICSDMWHPETTRSEELYGADVIIQMSIANDMRHIIPTRAFDSSLPIIVSTFQGGNYAVDNEGKFIDSLRSDTPGWLLVEVKPSLKKIGNKYGGKWDIKKGNQNVRNPKAYGILTSEATRPVWTDIFFDNNGNPQTKGQLLKRFDGRWDANDPALDNLSLVTFGPPFTSPYRVDVNYPHQLVNNEGNHLFILNKTAWAYFKCEYPQQFLQKAKKQGVNVIRVALEGRPYFDYLKIELWPWGGTRENPDWESFNESYWSEVEKRIVMAGEAGIGIDLVLHFSLRNQSVNEAPKMKKYWAYALQRLGKYSNILTWEIENENIKNEAFQDIAGEFFHDNDPYHRPVCSSDGTTDNAAWPQKRWMGLAIVHTCTGSTAAHDLKNWYQSIARNTRQYGKPAFNNESGRELRHKNDDPIHRRKQGWIWCAEGAFWTFHSWEGCEGINDLSYNGPGQEYLANMTSFFQNLPFWKMNPSFTALQINNSGLVHSTLVSSESDIGVTYLCSNETGKTFSDEKASYRLPHGDYNISFIDPVSLKVINSIALSSSGLGNQTGIKIPAFTDDIVIKFSLVNKKEGTIIEGTR